MSTNLFLIFSIIIFTVSLWRSAIYGETTSKPLWVVFVVPALASFAILCLWSGAHSSSDFIVVGVSLALSSCAISSLPWLQRYRVMAGLAFRTHFLESHLSLFRRLFFQPFSSHLQLAFIG